MDFSCSPEPHLGQQPASAIAVALWQVKRFCGAEHHPARISEDQSGDQLNTLGCILMAGLDFLMTHLWGDIVRTGLSSL